MASFQKIQELLLPCLEEEIIDDEEFSVLYEAYAPQNLPFQHSAYGKFSLENKNSAKCKADFRVDKRDIALLVEALRVPPIFKCSNGTICDGTFIFFPSCRRQNAECKNAGILTRDMKTLNESMIAVRSPSFNFSSKKKKQTIMYRFSQG